MSFRSAKGPLVWSLNNPHRPLGIGGFLSWGRPMGERGKRGRSSQASSGCVVSLGSLGIPQEVHGWSSVSTFISDQLSRHSRPHH